jgi:Cof subfamily protein (haloacid dehalogenase superfamily)
MNAAIIKTSHQFKLAAIDLDGTLLSPDSRISNSNLQALRTLHERGIQIVIASGRHYLSVRPILEALPEVEWIVSFQGGEVSNRERTEILERKFMQKAEVELVVEQGLKIGISPLVYGADEVFTILDHDGNIAFYKKLSGLTPGPILRPALQQTNVFKVLWVGTEEQISAAIATPLVSGIERVRTHHRIVEFMPGAVSKASGLQILATHLGISASEVVAFGDADNDISMFKWAGVSVAMAHGWPIARQSATMITSAGAPETALARGIEAVLQNAAQI